MEMRFILLISLVFSFAFASDYATEVDDLDGQSDVSAEEPQEEDSVNVVSSIEALILKMVEEQGLQICDSALAKSVMKTAWRRELDNTHEELEQRNRLIETCSVAHQADSSQHLRLAPYAPKPELDESMRISFKFGQDVNNLVPENDDDGIVKSWDALPSEPLIPRSLRRDGISTFSDVPTPTPEELKEINAIMKNKDGECTPRPVPVSVPLDPDPTVHLFPKCVLVKRCGGCCNHEALDCAPTPDGIDTVTHKVVGMTGIKMFLKRITFEEHVKCKCDCRVKATDCNSKQKYDAKNCKCRCNKVIKCSKPQEWVDKLCQCSCPERLRKDCATGMYYDTKKCKCVTAAEITGPKLPLPKKGA